MKIYADSPDIAERVLKSHKEHKMKKDSVIVAVASLIAKTDCKVGVHNWQIHQADWQHPMSGLQRLRELAKRFRLFGNGTGFDYAYEYRHNRYFPKPHFKRFCKQFAKDRT